MRKLILLLLIGVLLPSVGVGATITWTGAVVDDDNWGTEGNWSSNTVPTSVDDVVVDGRVNVNGVFSCNSLTIDFDGYVRILNTGEHLTVLGNIDLVDELDSRLIVRNGTLSIGGSFIGDGINEISIRVPSTIIFNGTTSQAIPSLSSSYHNLTLSGGAKTLPSAPSTLDIEGDFSSTASSVIAPSGSTVKFDGSAVQSAAAITYQNINITHTDGIDFGNANVTIQGNISGTSTIQNAGVLTFDAMTEQNLGAMTFTNIGEMVMLNGEKLYGSDLEITKLTIGSSAILISTPSVTADEIVNNGTFTTVTIDANNSFTNTGIVNATTCNVGTLTSSNDFVCSGTFTSTGAVTVTAGKFSALTMDASGDVQIAGASSSKITTLNIKGSGTPDLGVSGFELDDVNFTESSSTTIQPATIIGGDVVIGSSASLTLNAKLTVKGNWTNSGTFTPNGQTVCFANDVNEGNQTLLGASNFYDLEFTGQGEKSIPSSATINVSNELKFSGSSNITVGTNNRIFMEATASNQAVIPQNQATGSVTINGNINTNVYFTSAKFPSARWSMIAPPLSGVSMSAWDLNLVTTPGVKPSAFFHDEANNDQTGTGELPYDKDGWTGITTADLSTALNSGTPLLTYIDATFLSSDRALGFSGTPYFGNKAVSVTRTSTGANAGYNLLGNPYLCPLSSDDIISGFSGNLSGNAYSVWNSNNQSYDLVMTGGADLAVGQAFFAKVSAAGTFTFTEAMKSPVNDVSVQRESASTSSLPLVVKLTDQDGFYDRIYLPFVEVDEVDHFQLPKLWGNYLNMAVKNDDMDAFHVMVGSHLEEEDTASFQLQVYYPKREGQYTLNLENLDNIPFEYEGKLKDTFLGLEKTFEEIKEGYSYEIFGDEMSTNTERFVVEIYRKKVITDNEEKSQLFVAPNPITNGAMKIKLPKVTGNVKISVVDVMGAVVDTFTASDNVMVSRPWMNKSGVYFLNFRINGKLTSSKVLVN